MLALLSHLTLALAGVCLTLAELPLIPEMGSILVVYLILVGVAWKVGRRWVLRNWMANLLGLFIAGIAGMWVWWRLSDAGSWAREVELPGALIPYLGPVLMALLIARLFRPQRREDFWTLQGLGLLQVSLGCVLASDTLFGLFLFAYLAVTVCALACYERERQGGARQEITSRTPWVSFGVRWTLALAGIACPLFLVMPRLETPEWRPLTRFRAEPPRQAAAVTGFNDDIDLNRASLLENDHSLAFTVAVSDPAGRPRNDLPGEPRWRGTVLDRYQKGVWKGELSRPSSIPGSHPSGLVRPENRPWRQLRFEVPRNTGGLFLFEPIHLGSVGGVLPIQVVSSEEWAGPIPFFEAGGTVVAARMPLPAISKYTQIVLLDEPRTRFPAQRLSDDYLRRLLWHRIPELPEWTVNLLKRLAANEADSAALTQALERPLVPGWALPPNLWERVARLLTNHLVRSGEYTYSPGNRRVETDLDPVLDFLVNVREGSCERYAAGLTLMLRAVGIPARIVKGYRGADSLGDGTYHVLNSHAHAWVEAVVPASGGGRGLDWLVLDPTPSGSAPGFDLGRWWLQQQRTSQGFWRDLVVNYNSRMQAGLWEYFQSGDVFLDALPLVGVMMAGAILVWWVRQRFWKWRQQTASNPAGLYARLVAALARLNLHARPERTPRELADEGAALLAAREATASLADVPGSIVSIYYRHRYGGETIDPAETLTLAGRLKELVGRMKDEG